MKAALYSHSVRPVSFCWLFLLSFFPCELVRHSAWGGEGEGGARLFHTAKTIIDYSEKYMTHCGVGTVVVWFCIPSLPPSGSTALGPQGVLFHRLNGLALPLRERKDRRIIREPQNFCFKPVFKPQTFRSKKTCFPLIFFLLAAAFFSQQWEGGCTSWVTQRSPRQSPGCTKPTREEHWNIQRSVTRGGRGDISTVASKPKQVIIFDLVEPSTGLEAAPNFRASLKLPLSHRGQMGPFRFR